MNAKPYAVRFDVSDSLWMTTVSDESPLLRKRRRGRLRAYARQVWARAKKDGATYASRYLMLVTVGGRRESPVLACETLKPLIDAGTDMGLWPDDDPAHRAMTCYLRDPRPLSGGRAVINIWILPLTGGEDPLTRLLACVPDARGTLVHVTIPDREWLTSNMRDTATERRQRQTAIMRRAEHAWADKALGEHMGVVCSVSYPNPQYPGDPDNTAESLTAVLGAGVAKRLIPAVPQIVAFRLNPHVSDPHSHELSLLCFTCPPDMAWCSSLLAQHG